MLNNGKEIHSEKCSKNHYDDDMVLALQDYYNQKKKYVIRTWVMFNILGKITGAPETKIRKNWKKKEWIYQHETIEKNEMLVFTLGRNCKVNFPDDIFTP